MASRLLGWPSMRTAWVVLPLLACGGSSGSEGPEEPPILDRAPRTSHECAIEAEPTIVAQSQQQGGISLAYTSAGYLAARGALDEETFGTDVVLSALRFDPVELAPPEVEIQGAGYLAGPQLVARAGGLGLAWVDDSTDVDGQLLRFAVLDEAGDVESDPITTIYGEGDDASIATHSLVASPDGFGLLWSDDGALRFQAFDELGAPLRDQVDVPDLAIIEAHVVRRSDGHAAVWHNAAGIHVALLRDGDAQWSEPVLLAGPGPEGTLLARPAAVAVGDEVVVAWTERYSRDDYYEPDNAYALVRIARVSEDGELVGPPTRLQAGEYGFASALSSLLVIDGQLAIAWTRETYITACGGCMSDATLRVVLLDPVDLVPVSDPVELVGPSGLRAAPMVGTEEGDVAFFMTVDYHALVDLAAAKIRCAPLP